jgi:Ni2+-binding GTPase involved in maturation of urease and hydrogenase
VPTGVPPHTRAQIAVSHVHVCGPVDAGKTCVVQQLERLFVGQCVYVHAGDALDCEHTFYSDMLQRVTASKTHWATVRLNVCTFGNAMKDAVLKRQGLRWYSTQEYERVTQMHLFLSSTISTA